MDEQTWDDLVAKVDDLAARVILLEGHRPGRKRRPIVVSRQGVCGVDPDSDSAVCPYASIYRRRIGCLGDGCVNFTKSYYHTRRAQLRG